MDVADLPIPNPTNRAQVARSKDPQLKTLATLLGLAAALLAAGCAAPTTTHTTSAPKHHHTSVSVVDKALAAECKLFTKVNQQIHVATAADHSFRMYAATLKKRAIGWYDALFKAYHIADNMGVPLGPNKARNLAGALASTTEHFFDAAIAAKKGNEPQFREQWRIATAGLAGNAKTCAH